MPSSGIYSEISGFFEVDGIVLGNYFWAKYLGNFLGADEFIFEEFSLTSRDVFLVA